MNTEAALKPLSKGNDVIFEEPWQAQILAIADSLVQSGAFTAQAWAQALGDERQAAQDQNADDTAMEYYQCALRALEKLSAEKLAIGAVDLTAKSDEWTRAYLATPHGQPVELAAGRAKTGAAKG